MSKPFKRGALVLPILIYSDESRAGKDSVRKHITNSFAFHAEHGRAHITCKGYKFSTCIKDICNKLYGWAGVHRGTAYERVPSLRDAKLPSIGYESVVDLWVDVGRFLTDIEPTVVARQVIAEIQQDLTKTYTRTMANRMDVGVSVHIPVITDVRRPEELEYFRNAFKVAPLIIKVNGDPARTVKKGMDGLIKFDGPVFDVYNMGTANELLDVVKSLVVPQIIMQALALVRKEYPEYE